MKNDLERDASSADVNGNTAAAADQLQQPLSEEAKKKRRQEINRESARRVRKRKTEAHVQLQEEVRFCSIPPVWEAGKKMRILLTKLQTPGLQGR